MSSDSRPLSGTDSLAPGLRRAPSQKRSHATFDRIVSTARAVLQETGRDEFTLKQIIDQEADIKFGTLYQFFGSKKGLLDHLWPDREDTYLEDSYTPPEPRSKSQGLRNVPAGSQGRKTFNQIVDAAVHVLQTIGRDSFTMKDISTAADVSAGALYRYFDGKKGLLTYLWPDRKDTYLDRKSDT